MVERRGEPGEIRLGRRVEACGQITGGDLVRGVRDDGQRAEDVAGGAQHQRANGEAGCDTRAEPDGSHRCSL